MALYLFLMFLQSYFVLIESVVSAPVHVGELLYGLNNTEKRFLFQLMETVKLPVSKGFDTNMLIHSVSHNYDASLAQ